MYWRHFQFGHLPDPLREIHHRDHPEGRQFSAWELSTNHQPARPGEIYEYNKVTHVGLSLYEHMPSRMPAQAFFWRGGGKTTLPGIS